MPTSTATDAASALLTGEDPVDVDLDGGGQLYLERPLPFLTLYRYRTAEPAYRLHGGESAFCTLYGPADAPTRERLTEVVEALAERFGGVLLVEVWVDDDAHAPAIAVDAPQVPPPAVAEALRERLGGMDLPYVDVEARTAAPRARPPALFDERALARGAILHLGVELAGFFVDADTGRADPLLLAELRAQLHRALRQTFYDFVRLQTSHDATHFDQLGHRRVAEIAWAIDRELVEISTAFRFLELVTPTNDEEAFRAFADGGFNREPVFHYRFLPVDPEARKRQLFNLPIDEVADPTLAFILRDKRDETFAMLDMLAHRGRDRFRYGSLQVFGGVSESLLAIAESLLTIIPRPTPRPAGERLDAEAFLARARREFAYLAEQYPAAEPRGRLRRDLTGLMVSQGELNVGHALSVPAHRVEALVQHEVGTHVLTYWNGRAQPLTLLQTGTPGYEDLQEGLAVLSEWFVGGLTAGRFRTLAARVVAIDFMLRGNDFASAFALLHERHGLSERQAFQTVARAYRGGGFTKDAVYLRGLVELLAYLGRGGRLEPLLVGKLQLPYVPLIDELTERGILRRAPLTPRWYRDDADAGHPKLNLLRGGLSVFDLLPRASA